LDLDNDGDQDLVAAIFANLVVAANDGQGRFRIEALLPISDAYSLCASDYDADADLDIYVCGYQRSEVTENAGIVSLGQSGEFVYHDANNGASNHLFRNDIAGKNTSGKAVSEKRNAALGAWQFADVTAEVGLDVNNRRFTLAASWEDFDNDGDQDLYVANDYGRNNLFQNVRSADGTTRFVDIAARAGVEDSASGMSVSWGDYDLDGWMDIYIANMFSAAGNRITHQGKFKAEAPGAKKRLQRFARGNTLLRNRGDGSFEDTSVAAGVTMGRWAWGSNFVDINNDGLEDLVVANGYMTTDDSGDL